MPDVWFASDFHFGHENIIRFCNRPFESVREMDEILIENWNRVVKPGDRVWLPGDLCMGKIQNTLQYISRLNGNVVLMPGNHDKCWQGGRAGYDLWEKKYIEAGIERIIQTGAGKGEPEVMIDCVFAKMSHFPYSGDSHDKGHVDKYSAWRPDDEGGWLVHGHIHNNESASPLNGRMINVGVDVWDYTPAHIDQLKELVNA
jgi:calcineurin-like phosphoesterase family protein